MQNLPQKTEEQAFVDDILKRALAAKIITPDSYALENAVKSAWIKISSEGYNRACSRLSLLNSVMDMIVQGLNPVKEQCYFINYKGHLKLSRSYLGSIAVTKRFCTNVAEINAEIIYNGDELEFEIKNGVKLIGKHIQKFGNIQKDNIQGAYAIAVDYDGNQIAADIMTWDEILTSWERSTKVGDNRPIINGNLNPKSDHGKQPARFSRRTVINRLCKQLISATDDKELLRTVRKTSDEDTPIDDYIDISEDIEETPEPAEIKTLDFAPRPKSQPESESEPMATREQAEKIVAHHKAAGTDDKMMADISDFVGRQVEKIRYITQIEAAQYLDKIEAKNETPSDYEPPPWK